LPSRIATGSIGVLESIRARIRSDPSLLEEGLRIIDHDLKAGGAGTVDAIGVDRAGGLVIVALASADLDQALLRILDLHVWSTDQRDLLGRLYAGHSVAVDRPVRFLLLAPAFTHAFLRRLALLPIDVTPLLAREVAFADGARIAIEPAAPLFGLAAGSPGKSNGREAQAPPSSARPFWPDEVLPPEAADEKSLSPEPEVEAAEPAWPDAPDDRFPWELPDDPLPLSEDSAPPADTAPPAARDSAFETLTAEELQEFARFEKQRRERNGRST
jgi:hypothetical protein